MPSDMVIIRPPPLRVMDCFTSFNVTVWLPLVSRVMVWPAWLSSSVILWPELDCKTTFLDPSPSSKRKVMAAGSKQDPVFRIVFRRRIHAVPEKTHDVRMVDVSLLKGDQDFVVDFRHEKSAAIFSRQRGSHRRHGAFRAPGRCGN